jgi:hypothetical protein
MGQQEGTSPTGTATRDGAGAFLFGLQSIAPLTGEKKRILSTNHEQCVNFILETLFLPGRDTLCREQRGYSKLTGEVDSAIL